MRQRPLGKDRRSKKTDDTKKTDLRVRLFAGKERFSEEELRLRAPCITEFQLCTVVDIAGIVKVTRACGTALFAGAAFDADAGELRDIVRIDRSHGTD